MPSTTIPEHAAAVAEAVTRLAQSDDLFYGAHPRGTVSPQHERTDPGCDARCHLAGHLRQTAIGYALIALALGEGPIRDAMRRPGT